jgi:predicted dienelactone hydrolase
MQHVFTSDRDGTPIAIAMWYPSATPAATPDAAIVGDALPFVLIAPESADASVGHGDTALALANAGFVVATVEHTGVDPRIQGGIGHIMDRSQRVLNYVLADWNLRTHVDPARLGIFGSGEGGFAALVAIGGQPDLTTIPEHCNQFPQEPACRLIADATPASGGLSVVAMERPTETRFKAAVIAAPDFGFTFANGALKDVTVPARATMRCCRRRSICSPSSTACPARRNTRWWPTPSTTISSRPVPQKSRKNRRHNARARPASAARPFTSG